MEEGEEEQAYPDDVFAQYCDFAVEDEGEEDGDAGNSIVDDDELLVMSFATYREIAKVQRRRLNLTKC